MKTIIIGLGNPILGDDGVGWHVVEEVKSHIKNQEGIEFDNLAVGGLSLMERLIGYDHAILIDAIKTGQNTIGNVSNFSLSELPLRSTNHLNSAHNTTLQNAIAVGDKMGAKLPEEITIVAIEAENIYEFSEQLSDPVSAAVPKAAKIVLGLLSSME